MTELIATYNSRSINPVKHVGNPPAPGNGAEAGIVQRVERHVDALHASRRKPAGVAAQLAAIGR